MEQREIALIGKLTAGMTHELKNVLAIINESAGLMQDIFSHSGKNVQYMDKLEKAAGTIKKQVDKGADISTKFNTFSHSMDTETCQVTVNEIIEQVVFLMHRFANQKQIELFSKPLRKDKGFSTNATRLIVALCIYIDFYLARLTQAKKIVLKPAKCSKEIAFEIIVKGHSKRESEDHITFSDLPEMSDVHHQLQATVYPLKAIDQPGLKFVISE